MRKTVWVIAVLCFWMDVTPAQPTVAPSRRELHAAQCVAALEVNTEDLARQVKAGLADASPLLQSRLESGAAFIGDSYLHGTTDEARAHALADQALDAQKSLTDAQLLARQDACAAEGAKLLEASNGIERLIVRRFAQRRMNKLLGGPATPASAPQAS